MSLDIGFDGQAPSLPRGGGAVSGLGETFTPDLSTGIGSFAIPLDCPNGPNDIGPRLKLCYDTASANGAFGLGFSIRLPRIVRATAQTFPSYVATDALVLEGAGPLIDVGNGAYRLEVDAGAWQIVSADDGFRLTARDGSFYFLGVTPAGRLSDASGGGTFAWHLERIEDPLGNVATFSWTRDGAQLYLGQVAYGAYTVEFTYGPRSDITRNGRAGFLIATRLRCSTIELRMPADPQPRLRRWTLDYVDAPANGVSLLSTVTVSGFDAGSNQLDAPSLRLGYAEFGPRALERFQNLDDSVPPPPLSGTSSRTELVDWSGNGLADLIEISPSGTVRVWPNRGDLTWGRPRSSGDLPAFAQSDGLVAFADMNGDGIADVLRLDERITGFVPREAGGAFGRPVRWTMAPTTVAGSADARLIDLDGDGILDLLDTSEDWLALYYRRDPEGWDTQPQLVAKSAFPDLRLSDPHVFVADMTGDGSDDLVRLSGGGVVYWPYLGRGRWEGPVYMDNPPQLPFDVDMRRVFLTDIDGDGCADVVYLDDGRVVYWINQAGNGFSDQHAIDYVPGGRITDVRLADMRGTGTNGLLWSMNAPARSGAPFFFLDFTGATKPYLLTTIDNGLGLTTTIGYSTSALEAATDARAAQAWPTVLPVVVPVVARLSAVDAATGLTSATEYRYHQGRYDGVLREFAGFGQVDMRELGDASAPALQTTSWFHIGVDPSTFGEPGSANERRRLRAIRGRRYRQERYGLDGSPQEHLPYDRDEQTWSVASEATPGGEIELPHLVRRVQTGFERQPQAASVITTTNTAWDSFGNVTDSIETAEAPGDASQTRSVRTSASFASDPSGRFLALSWRVRQFDTDGSVLADTITRYDHAPEGSVGSQGLVTQRSSLAFTDALVADVYGAESPDFAALGYHQRAAEPGWWLDHATYSRVEDASGLHGTVVGPRGASTTFDFDAGKTFPVRITDALGNVLAAEYDYRVYKIRRLVDSAGATHTVAFDSLARFAQLEEPGDSEALPTLSYQYRTTVRPVETLRSQRTVSGTDQTIVQREFFDGRGRLLERREPFAGGEVATVSRAYSARGFVATEHRPFQPPTTAYTPPDSQLPHTAFFYDALGRLVRQVNPDGSLRTLSYAPLTIEEADEEDTRVDVGATHQGTPTRKHFDVTGRMRAIDQVLGERSITSTYQYDVKGNLIGHTDATGNQANFNYDLLGRQLRTRRPERDSILVPDPAGNPVEARNTGGILVSRDYDANDRVMALHFGPPTSPTVQRFVYHDGAVAAPPDAGTHTAGGRLVRVDDEAGTTIFDYDERGRRSLKRWRPVDQNRTFDLNFEYRADDRLVRLTYPDHGNARRTVEQTYDASGRLAAVPSIASHIAYNLNGQRTSLSYANGTMLSAAYDPATGRLSSMEVSGPGGIIRSGSFTWDNVANLLRIDSPDPKAAAAYVYDDLYRLIDADANAGAHYTYAYDDAGNLTHKSDVGDYIYGGGGAPRTCLTSAGPESFTYTPQGDMAQTPWGTQTFDPLGRLTRIASAAPAGQIDFAYDYSGARVIARSGGAIAPTVDRLTPDPLFAIENGALVVNFLVGGQCIARQAEGNTIAFLHFDHLGSLALVTDSAGAVVDSIRYDPYGKVVERTGANAALPAGFTGGVPEALSGLLYLQFRYYQPRLGRFISPDYLVQDVFSPIAWSSYVYCADNPASRVDPSGLMSSTGKALLAIGAIVLIVALVVVTAMTLGAAAPATATAAEAAALAAAQTGVGAMVSAGVVMGGLIGGIAAAKEGGDLSDVITASLVGAAVCGWAAYLTVFGEAAPAELIGNGIGGVIPDSWGTAGSILTGSINGSVTGAASGFASGIAGPITGHGDSQDLASAIALGAFGQAISGGILGGIGNFKTMDSTEGAQAMRPIGKFSPANIGVGTRVIAAMIPAAEQVATSVIETPNATGLALLQTGGVSSAGDTTAGLLADVVLMFGL